MFKTDIQVKGRFKFEVIKSSGERKDFGWHDNIVLDQGLRALGRDNIWAQCSVGQGSSSPTPDQTQLDSLVASTSNVPEGSSPTKGVNTLEGFWWIRKTFQFKEGQAAGRLTEVGLSTGKVLFNRALIRDARGQNTTIVVLEDEVLEVAVELRFYAKTTATPGVFNYVTRLPDFSENVTSRNTKIYPLFMDLVEAPTVFKLYIKNCEGFNGPVGSIYTAPTGNIDSFKNAYLERYADDQTQKFELNWSIKEGNSMPLRTIVVRTAIGNFQVEVDPVFEKTPQNTVRIQFILSWSRYE